MGRGRLLLHIPLHKVVGLRFTACFLHLLLLHILYDSIQHPSIGRKRYWLLGWWYAYLWCMHFRSKWCPSIQAFHPHMGWYLLLCYLLIIIFCILLLVQYLVQERDWSPIHANDVNESVLRNLVFHLRISIPRRARILSNQKMSQARDRIRRRKFGIIGGIKCMKELRTVYLSVDR